MQQRFITIQVYEGQNGEHLEAELKDDWRVVSVTPAAMAAPIRVLAGTPFAVFAVVLEKG